MCEKPDFHLPVCVSEREVPPADRTRDPEAEGVRWGAQPGAEGVEREAPPQEEGTQSATPAETNL